jgi:hypothetical protein
MRNGFFEEQAISLAARALGAEKTVEIGSNMISRQISNQAMQKVTKNGHNPLLWIAIPWVCNHRAQNRGFRVFSICKSAGESTKSHLKTVCHENGNERARDSPFPPVHSMLSQKSFTPSAITIQMQSLQGLENTKHELLERCAAYHTPLCLRC